MRDELKIIRDPEILNLTLEPTRSGILCLLSEGDMTVAELSERLDKHPSTVYRHIKKLQDHDFVYVSGSKWKSHSSEYIYGRTAKLFLPACRFLNGNGNNDMKFLWSEEQTGKVLEYIEQMGYINRMPDINKKVYDLFCEMDSLCCEKLEKLKYGDDMTYLDCLALKKILFLLSIVHDPEIMSKVESILKRIEEDG